MTPENRAIRSTLQKLKEKLDSRVDSEHLASFTLPAGPQRSRTVGVSIGLQRASDLLNEEIAALETVQTTKAKNER
jgi:hypothetical protein